ncbi:MAG: hypothetical protein IPG78_03700 [Ignavibacteria bacterium]|nr:hypothetical protein [Ignavibacteria bacterium]
MKLIILVVLILGFTQTGFSQRPIETKLFCAYDQYVNIKDICKVVNENFFVSESYAKEIVQRILSSISVKTKEIMLVRCENMKNAASAIYDSIPCIFYDNEFMESIDIGSKSSWASVSILAHEVGHHVNLHNLNVSASNTEQQNREWAADYFSGGAMYRLRATLDEAQSAIKNLPDSDNDSYPSREERLEAIKQGYNDCKNENENFIKQFVDPYKQPEVSSIKTIYHEGFLNISVFDSNDVLQEIAELFVSGLKDDEDWKLSPYCGKPCSIDVPIYSKQYISLNCNLMFSSRWLCDVANYLNGNGPLVLSGFYWMVNGVKLDSSDVMIEGVSVHNKDLVVKEKSFANYTVRLKHK